MQRRSDDLCAMQPDRPCSIPNRGILNANLEGIPGSFGTSTAAPVADRLRTTQPIVRSPNLMTAPSETRYRGALVLRPSFIRRLPQLRHPRWLARRLPSFSQKLEKFFKQPLALILQQRHRTLHSRFYWQRKISSTGGL